MKIDQKERPSRNSVEAFLRTLAPSTLQNLNLIVKGIPIVLDAVIASAKQIPEHTRTGLLIMAENGWYLDPEMTPRQFNSIVVELKTGNPAYIDSALIRYFRKHAERICRTAAVQFPERGDIIQSAFAAHRARNYDASIPTFLAQADGICASVFGHQLFTQNKNTLKKRITYQYRKNPFHRALLGPIMSVTSISRRTDPKCVPLNLNRHAVLHGLALNYGTEANSLKAISLLAYLGWVLSTPDTRIQLPVG